MSAPAESSAVRDLLRFIDASPTPYHAVAEATRRLDRAGFSPMDERLVWSLSPGTKGYVVRGGGTIVAFALGSEPPATSGFRILGAHTDSPNLRIKPRPDHTTHGYRQVGVEVYGGALLHTWLDRDLSIAGRVALMDGTTRLVDFERAVCNLPNLAIHLNQTLGANGLVLNAQQHMVPALGLGKDGAKLDEVIATRLRETGDSTASADAIGGYDLCLYDRQGAAIAGVDGELIHSARLDNLASCHAGLSALSEAEQGKESHVVILYDHEEIGSQSAAGARGRFLLGVLERLAGAVSDGKPDPTARALSRSLLVSADMAHAVHPNYSDRHEPRHLPRIGRGPVIKVNANQSYATDAPGAALFEVACREAGFKAQRFVSRNDQRC
jgi:aspartyl aminopeptidase